LLEFQNMNNGLHMKELVLCVELVSFINNWDNGAFGCVVWGWMLLGNKLSVSGVWLGQKTCATLGILFLMNPWFNPPTSF
jgi:hypothetical protein